MDIQTDLAYSHVSGGNQSHKQAEYDVASCFQLAANKTSIARIVKLVLHAMS